MNEHEIEDLKTLVLYLLERDEGLLSPWAMLALARLKGEANPAPHVEPSAAESEMSPLMRAAALHEACRPRPSATEARMLELARRLTAHPWGIDDGTALALAALVIERFGEKK